MEGPLLFYIVHTSELPLMEILEKFYAPVNTDAGFEDYMTIESQKHIDLESKFAIESPYY